MKAWSVVSAVASLCVAAGALAQSEPQKGPAIKSFKIQEQQKVAKQAQKEADQASEAARKAIESDPELKKMLEAGEPGEHHKKMTALVGSWIGTLRMWDAPGAAEQTSMTRATIKMDMDKRYLRSTYEGDFLGMPFRGQSIWGYNNQRKQYESTWIDNMSTAITFSTGTCDRDGKVFTFSGEADDPMSGKRIKQREVTTIIDSGSWKLETFKPGADGKEFKVMQIDFKSAGSSPAQAQRRSGRPTPKPATDQAAPASPK